jgi:hypothetical protein
MALLKRSRIKQVAIGLLVVTASCVVAVSGVNVFTNKKHSEPSVPKESILSLLDDNLPLLEGESFTMNDINNINEHHLAHDLDAVVKTDFFSTFKADINSPCSFGPVYSQCALEGGCDVTDGTCTPQQHLLSPRGPHLLHPIYRSHSRSVERVRPQPVQAASSRNI